MVVPWADLVEDDRDVLRRRVGLVLSEDERLGLIGGHRLHFVGGGTDEGLLERIDGAQRHWLRRGGMLLPYPGDRIDRVEEPKVKQSDVYDEHELYLRRLERVPPKTARQHRDLADHMYDVGNFAAAREHYHAAIRLEPQWRWDLQARLEQVDELMRDEAAANALRKARVAYRLHRDFAKARADLQRFLEEHPDRRRAGLQALDDLEEQYAEEQRKRFTYVKNDEFRRVIEDRLRTSPTLDEALSWVRAEMADEIKRRIGERMGLSPEEVEAFLKQKRTGAPHWASYWSGTFVFDKRAKRGQTTKKAIRGDPEGWWSQYGDVSTRGNFLRAYAAERLPDLFEVIQVTLKDCERCGGTGRTRHVSVTEVGALSGGQGHEWQQLCPRCFGAARDRAVSYR